MRDRPDLTLGRVVGTRHVLAMSEDQRATHMQVLGATGSGKSKFLEHLIRQDIRRRRGLCLIDPHGDLAQGLLAYVSRMPAPPSNFYYIAPHRDDFTICYNFLRGPYSPEEEWYAIDAFKLAALKVWGIENPKDTPLIDEWITNAFYTGLKLGLTLPDLGKLLEPGVDRNSMRTAVAERLPAEPSGIPAAWRQLCYLAEKRPVDFQATVSPALRRLADFLNKPRLRRIYGVPDLSLNLAEAMDEGAIILVDLSPGGRFSKADAHFFGTMMLADFSLQMFKRRDRRRGFSLYIDEFQNFATKSLADMLDEARKFGLRLVLSHQRPGQLERSDEASERDLFSAVMTNCRTKVVFGGVAPHELETVARALSMSMLDPDQIKRMIHTRSVIDYVQEYWTAHSKSQSQGSTSSLGHTTGSGSSCTLFTNQNETWGTTIGSSDSYTDSYMDAEVQSVSESETTFPVLVPVMGEQLSSVYYRTLDEQLYQFMAILHDQKGRHAMVRIVGQNEAVPIVVPFVPNVRVLPEEIDHQLELTFTPARCFLPVEQADAVIADRSKSLLDIPRAPLGEPVTYHASKPRRDIIQIHSSMLHESAIQTAVQAAGLKIQPRDFALLADLFECRIITVAQAAALYFDSEPVADRRLRKLRDAGFLCTQDYKTSGPGRAPTVYSFTKAAFTLLKDNGYLKGYESEAWDSKWRKRFSLSSRTIEHELGLMDIKAALLPALNEAPGLRVLEFGTWPNNYEFATPVAGRTSTKKTKPDGYLCLARHESPGTDAHYEHFFIEYDRTTEEHLTLLEKIAAYRTYYRTGGFVKWLGYEGDRIEDHPLRVLFVFLSDERLANFLETLGEEFRESRQLWMTTLQSVLSQPIGPVWLTPRGYYEAGAIDRAPRFSLLGSSAQPSTRPVHASVVQ